ncbi:MAG: hypothetical protein P1U81_02525 [Verrucomicrobiales bacterium]|jgi:hypothetical protein|nr:hypothetical protein [Verrucomicrobiales bacterium]
MGFFADIDDELTRDLADDYAMLFLAIRKLTDLLNVDSYDEMGGGHEHSARLFESERALSDELRHELREEIPENADPGILASFLKAYRLEAIYPDTVGPMEETASTIPLLTLPKFQARRIDAAKREEVYEKLAREFGVSEICRKKIDEDFSNSMQRLRRRRHLVDAVRRRVLDENGAPRPRPEIKAVFDEWFPDNPLRETEVEMVITRTCLYWCIPAKADVEPRDSEEETKAVEAWRKLTGRFAFQYFSHFPTFSSFDARDASPALVASLVAELGWSESDIIDGLNSTTTIERTREIEKYLIHDTWGHMWQGDLTRLRQLYDTMESLKSPVDANEHLTLPDGNVLSMLDLMYLNMRGQIRYDEELATRYMDQWIRLRIQALLAPIVAELTADCVEYKFKIDNPKERSLLPSSSIFEENPAKLDFAWVDLGYFVRSLRRTIAAYTKDEALKESLIDRICLLLKNKYPRQYRKVPCHDDLRVQVEATVSRFLADFLERQDLHLNQEILNGVTEQSPMPAVNSFFLLFTNFLRVQFTLNHLVQREMEERRPELGKLFNVLILFIVIHFEKDPLHRFWDLDETLGDYGLSVLSEISRLEA